jgi:hypothetical protein
MDEATFAEYKARFLPNHGRPPLGKSFVWSEIHYWLRKIFPRLLAYVLNCGYIVETTIEVQLMNPGRRPQSHN